MHRYGKWPKAGIILICFATCASAQGQAVNPRSVLQENRLRQLQQLELDQRLRANPDIPPDQRLLIDYGGFFTFNYFSIDDSAHNNHGLREYELVGYTRINLDNAQELFFRGRTDYNDYNPGDSFDGFGSRLINPDLDRGYYRFDLQKAQGAYGSGPESFKLVIEVGRDLAYWGNGLVLTEVLDGGRIDIGTDQLTVQGICGITPTRTVDIDTSRPGFNDDTRRVFYGAMLSTQVGDHRPYLYFLQELDKNNKNTSVVGPIITHFDYAPYYFGAGSAGNLGDRLRYGVEVAYEAGHTNSSSFTTAGGAPVPVIQTKNQIEAVATDLKLDYLSEGPHQTRYSAELIVASGDKNRGTSTNTFNGSKPGTRDRGFNGFGLLNTGLAFSAEASNLIVGRGGVSTFPFPDSSRLRRLQVGADFFIFDKVLGDAPISEPTGNHRFLGWEPDVYLNWQITSDLTLALRYGAFFPDHTAFSGSAADVRQFFYGGLTLAF